MIDDKEYKELLAMLKRIEKAGTIEDIAKNAPEPEWDVTTSMMPSIYGENSFEKIHDEVLFKIAFILKNIEKECGKLRYFNEYCKNLYEGYKPREKEIKHPDILKFIKDYENYYKNGGEA